MNEIHFDFRQVWDTVDRNGLKL